MYVFMQICIYVRVYVCMCKYVYIYMYFCLCACMSVCMYVCTSVCIYLCTYACMYEYMYIRKNSMLADRISLEFYVGIYEMMSTKLNPDLITRILTTTLHKGFTCFIFCEVENEFSSSKSDSCDNVISTVAPILYLHFLFFHLGTLQDTMLHITFLNSDDTLALLLY
jgi:hypothetical protein